MLLLSHVDFKKWPCRPVWYKGRGPVQSRTTTRWRAAISRQDAHFAFCPFITVYLGPRPPGGQQGKKVAVLIRKCVRLIRMSKFRREAAIGHLAEGRAIIRGIDGRIWGRGQGGLISVTRQTGHTPRSPRLPQPPLTPPPPPPPPPPAHQVTRGASTGKVCVESGGGRRHTPLFFFMDISYISYWSARKEIRKKVVHFWKIPLKRPPLKCPPYAFSQQWMQGYIRIKRGGVRPIVNFLDFYIKNSKTVKFCWKYPPPLTPPPPWPTHIHTHTHTHTPKSALPWASHACSKKGWPLTCMDDSYVQLPTYTTFL